MAGADFDESDRAQVFSTRTTSEAEVAGSLAPGADGRDARSLTDSISQHPINRVSYNLMDKRKLESSLGRAPLRLASSRFDTRLGPMCRTAASPVLFVRTLRQ
jgi:hypothetical protein